MNTRFRMRNSATPAPSSVAVITFCAGGLLSCALRLQFNSGRGLRGSLFRLFDLHLGGKSAILASQAQIAR